MATGGLSRLSLLPLHSFVLRLVHRRCPGRSRRGGVGLLEYRGGLRGAWAGKARPKLAVMCKNFLSYPEELTGSLHSHLNEQTNALPALCRQRWCGDSNLEPLGPVFSPRLSQPSFSFYFPTPPSSRPKLSNFIGRLSGHGERVPGAPQDALR